MHYIVSMPDPASGYLDIALEASSADGTLDLHLPCWRPGRYITGQFAKNVQRFEASGADGEPLPWTKTHTHRWRVSGVRGTVRVRYRYYAARIDGGSCYVSPAMLYMNPVQCCLFDPARPDQPCTVDLRVPEGWTTATSLVRGDDGLFRCGDYDTLADSPVLSSPTLQHRRYTSNGGTFHIWIQGVCQPGWDRILEDFRAFTDLQVKTMGDIPVEEFHFLVHVLPYRFYHGVEHLRSTVLVIGPGDDLMGGRYADFIGVASHELFHVWNVKTIRPAAMLPYDFTRENLSGLGYVYEGVTTYYGDLFLARTGFFTFEEYMQCIAERIQRHLDNPGHLNYSVVQSSFDTWLDGYEPGAPGRKTSIYDEGSVVALMLDLLIRRHSGNARSLDDVMRWLYTGFGKAGKGYAETDIEALAARAAGVPLDRFFREVVDRPGSYAPVLGDLLEAAGLGLSFTPAAAAHERLYGFRAAPDATVRIIWPGSPAARGGLMIDDRITAVNGVTVDGALDGLFNLPDRPLRAEVVRQGLVQEIRMEAGDATWFDRVSVVRKPEGTQRQQDFLRAWLGR